MVLKSEHVQFTAKLLIANDVSLGIALAGE